VELESFVESCDELNCQGKWTLQPKHRFLLLGHIMRSHQLFDASTMQQVFPISSGRGSASESFNEIRIYAVQPLTKYILVASKPKATRLAYFIGILPRSSDREGILSIPDIGPTMSTIATMGGFGLLSVLIFAAFFAPATGAFAAQRRRHLRIISLSAVSAIITSAIGSGVVDSLIPDGEIRSRMLRTALIASIMLLPLSGFFQRFIKRDFYANLAAILAVVLVVNLNWTNLRAGLPYVVTMAAMNAALVGFLYLRLNSRLAASLAIFGFYDPITMMGWRFTDMPHIYILHFVIVAAMSLAVADLGAISVIALAGRAYRHFTREMALKEISTVLTSSGVDPNFPIADRLKDSLPIISKLTGAGQVSILVNLPFGRPITHSFSSRDNQTVTHDDGRIPGAVTLRSFVYGDECWFESYKEFAKKLDIPYADKFSKAEFVCIAPIKVNHTNLGVIMLTSFDDEHIRNLKQKSAIDDEKATGRLLVDTLASAFSSVVIHHLRSHSSRSTELLAKIRDAIPTAADANDFLQSFADAVSSTTGVRAMLHKRVDNQGCAVCQSGFAETHWSLFLGAHFNLGPSANKAYGSTVVAFKEGKSSYLKDWREIQDKLHSKTNEILAAIDARSFLAIPLRNGDDHYVITLISSSHEPHKDPGIIESIESTEAIFDAALTVLNQKSSVMALGKLANRLIGDDHVREQIISAAKNRELPTTIGTPRASFLLLFDLVGSSYLPADTEAKARAYGLFYDQVNRAIERHLGGKIRKTIGDAIIATWDGTGTDLNAAENLLESLLKVAMRADEVAQSVGCAGIRALLHYGEYFFGLVGTQSFGQIDVIGRGIDEVCKMEGAMKAMSFNGERAFIAHTCTAVNMLSCLDGKSLENVGYLSVSEGLDAGSGAASIGWVLPRNVALATLKTDTALVAEESHDEFDKHLNKLNLDFMLTA
jgi:class 3 adenylate cyclase